MMEIENRDDLNKLDRLGKEALSDDKLMGLVLNGTTLMSVKLDKAKVLQTENTMLKEVLTELVQTGQYTVCELCGADCIDAGLDFVDEVSQCGCFKLRDNSAGPAVNTRNAQEQAEREKGCEYCNSPLQIGAWHVTEAGFRVGQTEIAKFCPRCGKRLE